MSTLNSEDSSEETSGSQSKYILYLGIGSRSKDILDLGKQFIPNDLKPVPKLVIGSGDGKYQQTLYSSCCTKKQNK